MMEPTDLDLLRAYTCDCDEAAFAQLVQRHAGWIFAAARRRLRDDHLADDATQAVFLVLAEKAAQLVEGEERSLSAWLFHVMHFACNRTRRSRARFANHEREAAGVRETERTGRFQADATLLALLEDTIAELPMIDREPVVRRFYRRESFASIGASLDITAEAARKHISRSIVKLRTLMARDRIDAIPDGSLGSMEQA